jgi:YesN/AraC family two-component response regulator
VGSLTNLSRFDKEPKILMRYQKITFSIPHLSTVCHVEEIDIVLKVKKYLEDNFYQSDITLKNISLLFSYNDRYISEKFKQTVKIGFNEYLQKLRIDYSIYLISIGIKNVNEIAKSCGYNDPFYFSKVFVYVKLKMVQKHSLLQLKNGPL